MAVFVYLLENSFRTGSRAVSGVDKGARKFRQGRNIRGSLLILHVVFLMVRTMRFL
jgi:hypothetical protein